MVFVATVCAAAVWVGEFLWGALREDAELGTVFFAGGCVAGAWVVPAAGGEVGAVLAFVVELSAAHKPLAARQSPVSGTSTSHLAL